MPATTTTGMIPWLRSPILTLIVAHSHPDRRATREGEPVFGPRSPIATAEACDAVGGRFVPRLFGWMVHVEAFDRS